MQIVVIYEPASPSIRHVADALGEQLAGAVGIDADVLPLPAVAAEDLSDAAVVIVGARTHHEGVVDDGFPSFGPAVRQWLRSLPPTHGKVAAAFDVHARGERGVAGVLARGLGRHGFRVVAAEGFVCDAPFEPVTDAEVDRARRWAEDLVRQVASALPT